MFTRFVHKQDFGTQVAVTKPNQSGEQVLQRIRQVGDGHRDSCVAHDESCGCPTSPDAGEIEFDPTSAALGLVDLMLSSAQEDACWEYIEKVFDAAFRHGLDVNDENLIDELRGQVFTRDEKALQQMQAALEEVGIFNSPAYVLNGERFHGRQHLPLLRWLLTGRQGNPPV